MTIFPGITMALSGLLALLVFIGMLWWFMFYAAASSVAPFWFAAISALLVIPTRAARSESGFLTDLSGWLLSFAAVAFMVLGALMRGFDEGGAIRLGIALAFFIGAIAFSSAVGLLMAGPLRPKL